MFTKLATITLAVLAATPALVSALATTNKPSCNTDSLQCCKNVYQSNSKEAAKVLSPFNIAAGSVTGLVGADCNSIVSVLSSGTSCNQQTVCCTDNRFEGVVALGCTPINLNA
ncbi:hypothetical protein NLJ89_g8988 [Agrocybe chaxingu]|uniref:Hydrophobin n=1 Tax=Agrocybe chaxingu TaxID=84603 RepID=A0A9W8K0U7_9AGAR|nr:hypothetical protein NLJ89_g8988 [Agrocybe chaxingu]